MTTLQRGDLFRKSRYYGRLVVELFWAKVVRPKNGCWLWIGANMEHGYGKFFVNGENFQAHRVAWTIARGEIPKGLKVAHSCDNKLCVNPAHLFLATSKENSQDMVEKGRQAYGEKNGQVVLTEDQVREIFVSSEPQRSLGKRYGVHQSTISLIKRRKKWRHLGL